MAGEKDDQRLVRQRISRQGPVSGPSYAVIAQQLKLSGKYTKKNVMKGVVDALVSQGRVKRCVVDGEIILT